MKIIIFEPHASGHHGPYLVWMVKGLISHGFSVTVVTFEETVGHPSMTLLVDMMHDDKNKNLKLVTYPTPEVLNDSKRGAVALAKRELAYWRLFKKWYNLLKVSEKPDIVFLPYLDYCLYAIGLFGSPFSTRPWAGLAMRPSFHYRKIGINAPKASLDIVKRGLFFRALRNSFLLRLLTIDEPLANYLEKKIKYSNKIAYFPEPAELGVLPARELAKRMLGLDASRKLILLYGSITLRKGVAELLHVLSDSGFPATVDVLLAGKVVEPAARKLLNASSVVTLRDAGRLRLIERFIAPSEEPVLFAAADIIWLGYKGHYSASGLLVQAAVAHRPVLACRDGVIGWQTQRHKLGVTINPQNIPEVLAAVRKILDSSQEYASKNTWQPVTFGEVQDKLARILRERLMYDE